MFANHDAGAASAMPVGRAETENGECAEVFLCNGIKVPVIPSLFSPPIVESIKRGDYECYEANELKHLVEDDEVILEIGAGCGFISTLCALDPRVKSVHAVEANPAMIPVIKLTHKLNNVSPVVYNEILAKEDGEVDFFVHEDFWASGTADFLGRRISVKSTSFQRRLDAIQPTMLIVDIEGGEQQLFDDVNLNGVKKILMEVHQNFIKRNGIKHVFDMMGKHGFHYDQNHSHRAIVAFSHVSRPI